MSHIFNKNAIAESKYTIPLWVVMLMLLFCVLLFVSEIINGRFWQSDFNVYYGASTALLHNQRVYGIAFGLDSGFYKYSPFFLLLVAPFTFFKFKTAAIIYYFLNSVVLVLVFFQIDQLFSRTLKLEKFKAYKWIFLIIFIFSLNLINRELHLGNTNLLLLFLILTMFNNIKQNQFVISGFLLMLILMIKPFLLVLILPLLFFKKSRVLLYGVGFGVIQLFIVLIIFGSTKFVALHFDWISSITSHAGSFPSNNNITHFIKLLFNINPPEYLSVLLFTLLCLCYIVNEFFVIIRKKIKSDNDLYIYHSLFLIAILPTILNTDSEHFLMSLPLIALITYFMLKSRNPWSIALFTLTFVLFGTNTNDLVGKTIGDFYDIVGVVGLANMIILIWSSILIKKFSLILKKNS